MSAKLRNRPRISYGFRDPNGHPRIWDTLYKMFKLKYIFDSIMFYFLILGIPITNSYILVQNIYTEHQSEA